MIFNKNIGILILALGMTTIAFGQLETGEVDVIKNFDARLLDSERRIVKPELPPLDTTTKRQTYNFITKTTEVEYLPPKIRPIAMKGDEIQKGYDGFLRLGGGLPAALFGEGSYNITSQENLDFGIYGNHYSANNNNNVENQRFSNTKLGLGGTYYLEQGYAVNADVSYSRDAVYFYGYNEFNAQNETNFSFEPDAVKQRFAIFDASAKIFNGERTVADFNYSAGVDFYTLRDNYSARENGFIFKIDATKWFDETHPLKVQLITDFTSYKDTAKQSLNNFFLKPSYTYHHDVFKAKIGVSIASHEDEFFFFPDLELSANIVEGLVNAFVGAEGDLQKNSFRNLTEYNPYLVSRNFVENTSYYHFYGGIKGNIQGIDYHAQVGYKSANDLALFTLASETDPIFRFQTVYDTVNIFNIKASLSAPVIKGVVATATLNQNFFSPKREDKAWHLPNFSLNVGAKYTSDDGKLGVKADMFIENGAPYPNKIEGTVENLNNLFDINFGTEYFFTDNIGGFFQINNLLNNKQQRWRYYPQMGLNVLVGISARF